MQVYPKQNKNSSSTSFYGDRGEISLGFSLVQLNSPDRGFIDKKHYHRISEEFYLVVEGEITVEVEGNDIKVNKNRLLIVEPKEVHYVKQIIQYPCTYLTISTNKQSQSDKVEVK